MWPVDHAYVHVTDGVLYHYIKVLRTHSANIFNTTFMHVHTCYFDRIVDHTIATYILICSIITYMHNNMR